MIYDFIFFFLLFHQLTADDEVAASRLQLDLSLGHVYCLHDDHLLSDSVAR